MPEIDFGTGAYKRDRGDLVELPVVNMFVEKSRSEPKQIILQSRPGLIEGAAESGDGPVTGMFKKDGVQGGALFAVSNGILYKGGVFVGYVTGNGPVSIAGNEIGIAVTAGLNLHFYNGTTLATVAFPDGARVRKIVEIAGRFVAIRDDTQKFYWTDVLEFALVAGALTFDALDFASAENEPDKLLDMIVLNDVLVMFGSETVEHWPKTGDAELPFRPTEGRVFTKGIIGTGCATVYDNYAAWIGNEGLVYVGGQVPQALSDDGIDERIAESTSYRLFNFYFEGSEFLALRLDAGTWLRNAKTGEWCEFASHGQDNFVGGCAVSGPLFGSAIDGRVFAFGSGHYDLGGVLERRFRAGSAIAGGTATVDNLRLRTNVGHTVELTGEYASPVIEMRTSRDGAQTWGNWRTTSLGAQGKYRERVEWRALGMFDAPGFVAEFRVTDPVPFRVSGVAINEQGGGRSR